MKALKFCMLTTFYPPYNFGGDGIFVYRLANALARRGHQVHVIHTVDAYKFLGGKADTTSFVNHKNLTLHSLTAGSLNKLDLLAVHQFGRPVLQLKRIKKILENLDFDVIHFHNISLLGGPRILKYGEATKLCTLHDAWFVCAMHVLWRFNREACTQRTCLACTLAGGRPPQLWRYNGSLTQSLREVDSFIGASRFVQTILPQHGFPEPIRHIPHFLPEEKNEGLSAKRPHPRPYFLFAGRLEKLKGVQVLIKAFKDYPHTDLIVAGTGTYEPELMQIAKGFPNVHFLGLIGQKRLRNLYFHAIATLVPSIGYETFGLTILESFQMRTPVIAHNLGAFPEIVNTSGGGLIYDTVDELMYSMETLRLAPSRRETMGEKGYHSYLANFTEEIHLKKYFSLIREFSKV